MSGRRSIRRELAVRYGGLGLMSGILSCLGMSGLVPGGEFLPLPGLLFGAIVLAPLLHHANCGVGDIIASVILSIAAFGVAYLMLLTSDLGVPNYVVTALSGACGALLLAVPISHHLAGDTRVRDILVVGVAGLIGGLPFFGVSFWGLEVFGIVTGMLTWQTLVAIALARLLPDWWRTDPNRCATCDYDLTGNTTGVCPECGSAIG